MLTLKIVCPACATVNNLDIKKKPATCLECKKPLDQSFPSEVSDENCLVQINENDIPVLIDFYSPTCVPCMEMADDYEGAAFGYPLKVRFLKVNTANFQKVAKTYGVTSLPTIIAFKEGKEIKRVSTKLTQHELNKWAKNLLEL